MAIRSRSPLSARIGVALAWVFTFSAGASVVALLLLRRSYLWAACAWIVPVIFIVFMIGVFGERAVKSVSVAITAVMWTAIGAWGIFRLFHLMTGMGPLYGNIASHALILLAGIAFWIYTKDPIGSTAD